MSKTSRILKNMLTKKFLKKLKLWQKAGRTAISGQERIARCLDSAEKTAVCDQ